MSDRVVLVTGYSTTGKDTFYRQVTGASEHPFNWTIYHTPGVKPLDVSSLGGATRVSFADILKVMVCKMLDIKDGTDIESLKTVVMHDGRTFRQWLIDVGCQYRAIDPFYWCRAALDPVWSLGQTTIVTDWRFPSELQYATENCSDVSTVRLYSSSVKDSPFDVDHQLDNTVTDYLCVRGSDGFRDAYEVFPFYKYYVPQ